MQGLKPAEILAHPDVTLKQTKIYEIARRVALIKKNAELGETNSAGCNKTVSGPTASSAEDCSTDGNGGSGSATPIKRGA